MKNILRSTMAKFLLVGVLNTLIGCGTMFLLYNLVGCSYWISSAANYLMGSIVSFFLNKHFTFRNHERSWKQVAKFGLNVIVCYIIAYGVAKPLVFHVLSGQATNIQENVALWVGMCLYTGMNYLGQRFFAFYDGKIYP